MTVTLHPATADDLPAARAGRTSADDPAVLRRFDAACRGVREPCAGTGF